MFTGLIEEVGRVVAIERADRSARLTIGCREVVTELPLGASVAVDGCCVTATDVSVDAFTVDLMLETMRVTALGELEVGDAVNLERALRVGDRLGGHLVQGHVDGVGEVVDVTDVPGTRLVSVRIPADLARYLVAKGSLCVAGVSLTVARLEDDVVTIGLIPHTLGMTNLAGLAVGDRVNLEVDVVAKYVERMLHVPTSLQEGPEGEASVAGHALQEEGP
jgi:riboflavin synthase